VQGFFVVLVGYEFLVVADEDAFLLIGVAVLAALQVVDGAGRFAVGRICYDVHACWHQLQDI